MEDKFSEAFNTIKINKTSVFDEIHVNVINQVYNRHIVKLAVLTKKMKLVKITPIFQSGKNKLLINYRSILILPRFSKILEKIIYNRPYKYLTENNLLFNTKFAF